MAYKVLAVNSNGVLKPSICYSSTKTENYYFTKGEINYEIF